MTEEPDSPPHWRLLVDGDLPGALNMARDVAILEAVAGGACPPTLRLYGWNPPCLSLGHHQGLDAVDIDFCRDHGVDVVRRPTGGRALLHHLELTYSVVAPLGRGPIPQRVKDAYRTICGVLVKWSRELGVDAELTPDEFNIDLPKPTTPIPCFEAPAGGEIVVAGRKLIGSAMRARRPVILQHGSILVDWDGVLQAGSMRLADDSFLRLAVTTFTEQLGETPDRVELEMTLVEAFSGEFGVRFQKEALTEDEAANEQEILERFEVAG